MSKAAQRVGEVVSGLLFVDETPKDLHAHLNTRPGTFNRMGETELCQGNAALEKLNAGLR